MKKYILTSLLLLTVISSVIADELSFVASAPKSVVVNQQFRLSYKVNRINVNEPTIPEIKGFMVLYASSGLQCDSIIRPSNFKSIACWEIGAISSLLPPMWLGSQNIVMLG